MTHRKTRCPPEVRELAARLVQEHNADHESE